MSGTWTIGELAERAADLLGSELRVNGRVREVPNERLIRWYTTIGLLDPPAARRGRLALYGNRHLLQLVAVKRRQAEGLSIAAIQAELAGATNAMLQRIAGLTEAPQPQAGPDHALAEPPELGAAGPGAAEPGRPSADTVPDVARTTDRKRFWARPAGSTHFDPAGAGHTGAGPGDPVPAPRPSTAHGRPGTPDLHTVTTTVTGEPAGKPPGDVLFGVRLAPGVTVMLESAHRPPGGDETATLRRAAAPLLAALGALGLAGPFEDAETTTPWNSPDSATNKGMT
ncbi:MerR family transcriptional regulator [Microbispora sp. NBC_01189]|uniref:MerR family transcriptional regulator n=1 Tax=Microbispora sp. NBC_01189 TaxID=2903583 RepID=UPI002E0D9AA4|nr:MerR family transcriptional regulator [Microbispora sp. NBC_01189]